MTDDRWLFAWALGSVALGGASLLVPLYVVSLGGDAVALGALAAVAALAAVPGALVVGRLADRTERRRGYVVAALVAVGATLLALPFVDSVAVVVAANGVVWLAAAAAAPVLTLLVTVGAPEREWPTRFGVLNTYQGWGWVGGLAGGLAWTTTGAQTGSPLLTRRTFFLACGIAALVAAALAVRWLPPEPGRERSPRRIARALARTRRFNVRGATFPFWPSRTYWSLRTVDPRRLAGRLSTALGLTYVAVALAFTGFAAFFAPLPLFLTDAAGFDSGTVFGLYLASSLGSALLYVGAGRLASRADPSLVLVGGLSARAVLFPAVALLAGGLDRDLPDLPLVDRRPVGPSGAGPPPGRLAAPGRLRGRVRGGVIEHADSVGLAGDDRVGVDLARGDLDDGPPVAFGDGRAEQSTKRVRDVRHERCSLLRLGEERQNTIAY